MKPGFLSASEILDEACGTVVRTAAPWLGILWLTALPLRLLQVHFIDALLELGKSAKHHGEYLLQIALASGGAFVLSLLGRAIFARACDLYLASRRSPGREALRVPGVGFASYLYVSLLIETLFYALLPSLMGAPVIASLAALAAATYALNERPSLIGPIREITRHASEIRVLLVLMFVFASAWLVAGVNIFATFEAGLWMASGVPGFDPTIGGHVLSLSNRLFVLLILAGASLAVEPFWLAAHLVYVNRLRARQSGEDLEQWFETLRSEPAA